MPAKFLVIGDPHFKIGTIGEDDAYVDAILKVVSENRRELDAVVFLGDSLDTHDVVRVQPHKNFVGLVSAVEEMVKVYLIIGNHDYINGSQFLTDNHIFTPLKKWPNTVVVDSPMIENISDQTFVFCPYAPPGRFIEALSTIPDDGVWELADCIFAHQEFLGCQMGAHTSDKGDDWPEDYPPVISGHIHDAQRVGSNVYYPGSSRQHTFGDSAKKCVWLMSVEDGDVKITKVPLGLPSKKIIHTSVSKIGDFDVSVLKKSKVKIVLEGRSEQFKAFRKSTVYTNLVEKGVVFSFDVKTDVTSSSKGDEGGASQPQTVTSFMRVLKEVVKKKPVCVRDAYRRVCGIDVNGTCEVVCEGAEEDVEGEEEDCVGTGSSIADDDTGEDDGGVVEIISAGEEDDVSDLESLDEGDEDTSCVNTDES